MRRMRIEAVDTPIARSDDDMLRWIAHATAPLTGADFFQTLMRHLAEAFGLRRGLIAERMNEPASRMGQMASAIAHESDQSLTAVRTYAQACQRLLKAGAHAG